MNVLKLDLMLFWEFAKLYEKYGLKFKLVQRKYNRHLKLICLNNNEILLRNTTKEILLGILQDNDLGLYNSKNHGIPFMMHDILMEKIKRIAVKNMPKITA